ncbi:hypothetical protein Leryth_013458 [Lithospermum erythrorhizon]|nr:hypothetical protein Leryth_013458 [Lithospermum erythrorhizon]
MAIDGLPRLIAAQMNHLITHSPFTIKVQQVRSGCKNPTVPDRFTLTIPFCLDFINWDVIYNALYPLAAPDVIFGPEDETFRPYHSNALSNWNAKDPSKLLALILQLRELYVAYQKERVGKLDDERLKFELNTMLSREGIEMHMSSVTEKTEEVKFAVRLLEMDLNKVVVGSTWRNPKIHLQVVYPVTRQYSLKAIPSAPRLKLVASPELRVLFSIEDFRLPVWIDGMCMAEYLPALEEKLDMQVKDAIASIGARRKIIEALVPHFGRPLEADPVFCRKATFLACSGTFTFMVHFSLPVQFPKQQPNLVLQSSQHFHNGSPVKSQVIDKYPWSPRWDTSEMAVRIFNFLVDECLGFKKYCNETTQY